jgi:hypothetical protein
MGPKNDLQAIRGRLLKEDRREFSLLVEDLLRIG